MLIQSLEEQYIQAIGHAFGYYDYGSETGLAAAFESRDKTAVYIEGFARAMKKGGAGLHDRYTKQKKPCVYISMVCVPEAYQHQGYMRSLLDMAYREGDRLGVPVILETDAMSKCVKYQHLGMELAGTRDVGAFGKLYDLIRYPKTPSPEEPV